MTTTSSPLVTPSERAARTHPFALDRLAEPRRVAGAVLAVFAVLVITGVHSPVYVNHVTGAWIEQAESVRNGHLYLPIGPTGEIGGTRYLPLPIALHGGLAALLGDPVAAGKLVSFLSVVVLGVLCLRHLDRVGAPRRVALALVTLPLLTVPGMEAVLGIRHDLTPTIAFVACLLLVRRDRVVAAPAVGALIGIALLSKSSAVWVALAVAITLATSRRWRPLGVVTASAGATVAAGFAAAHIWSAGRVWDNLRLDAGDVTVARLVASPRGFASLVVEHAGVALPLLVVAAVEVAWAVRARAATLLHVGVIANALVVMGLTADPGVDDNHLLDLFVLGALCTGAVLGRMRSEDVVRVAAALCTAALALGAAAHLMPNAQQSAADIARGRPLTYWDDTTTLPGIVDATTVVLSDDPMVARRAGQVPRVADAFMLRAVVREQPEVHDALAAQITGQEFDVLVLLNPLEDTGPYGALNFGTELRALMRDNYELAELRDGYWIYRPRG